MIYRLIAFSFVLVYCGAQEHLTCLRTDNVIAPSPPSTNDNAQQGRPGRRGPVGLQGFKGEPGIPDNSLIDSLKGKKIIMNRLVNSVSFIAIVGCLVWLLA